MERLLKEKDLKDIVCDLHIHTSCSDGGKEASFCLRKSKATRGEHYLYYRSQQYRHLQQIEGHRLQGYFANNKHFHQKIGQIEKKEIGCQLSQKITLNMLSQVFLKIFSINFAKNNKNNVFF